MTEGKSSKQYDLEKRTLEFAKGVRDFTTKAPKSISNLEYSKQIIRSSGSVGANYIEANESLSKKDFILRIKICRKESKETRYWLELFGLGGDEGLEKERRALIQEATELMMIFSSIMRKTNPV